MNPDNFQRAWQSQSSQAHLKVDADLLLKELQRNQHYFTAVIFWRDVREVGTALLMVPLWIYLGVKLSFPWTWYLTVPALVWIAGFMVAARMRRKRQPPASGEPLRKRAESLLAQVEHQIWLLRNVFWWYLLPVALSGMAFLGQISWLVRASGWLAALVVVLVVLVGVVTFAAIYRLNRDAIRSELEPRRQELETLLLSLNDETPAAR